MRALITGASSGIGYEMAKYLNELGHDLILVARDKEKLTQMQEEFAGDVKIIVADLSIETKVKEVYILCKNEDIDILINNAGVGTCSSFEACDLNTDMDIINLNIKAVHTLTKLFLKDMKSNNRGYILNVSSAAAFQAGPLMATYYASKAYVYRLSVALYEELRREKSKVVISCLMPGPVNTAFNEKAGVRVNLKLEDSKKVARLGIDQMFKGKLVVVTSFRMKFLIFFSKFLSTKWKARISYKIQSKKIG